MLNPKKRKKILTRLITPRCIGKFITGPPDRPRGGDKLQSGWKMAIGPWRRSENASTILGISIHQERARMLELNKKMFTSLSSVKWNIVDQPLHYQLFLSGPGEGHRLKIYERLHCKWAQRTRKDREIKSVKKSSAAGWRWNNAVPKVPAALHTTYFAWSITGARAALCQNWNEVLARE